MTGSTRHRHRRDAPPSGAETREGFHYHESRAAWKAEWADAAGAQRAKWFSARKYGYMGAFDLAVAHLQRQMAGHPPGRRGAFEAAAAYLKVELLKEVARTPMAERLPPGFDAVRAMDEHIKYLDAEIQREQSAPAV